MNKKSIIKTAVLAIVLCLLVFMGYKMYQKMSYKKQVAQQIASLPVFSFTDLQGNSFANSNLKQHLATVFVHFNSECDFCLHEAQSIQTNLSKFSQAQFVFISTEEIEVIEKFAREQQLLGVANVTFLQDKMHNFAKNFDANSIPYSLIYNNKGVLLARYKGQIKAEIILQVLAEK